MKNTDFEIRTSELTASNKKLVGYAVRWNCLSEIIWDEFREHPRRGLLLTIWLRVMMCAACMSMTIPDCWGAPNPALWY